MRLAIRPILAALAMLVFVLGAPRAEAEIVLHDLKGRTVTLAAPAKRLVVDDGRMIVALSFLSRDPVGLIAEVKKASPSKGLIRPDFHPVSLAQAYERAGTDCISVLTDVDYFQGSNDYLTEIRSQVKVPLLRKDFTIDERQIYEARLIGADAILLIAAILTPKQLADFHTLGRDLGLDVLVEVHNRPELETVLEFGQATLIGVNNRDLKTFVTDLSVTEQLIGLMPSGVVAVSESAIATMTMVKISAIMVQPPSEREFMWRK